MHSRSFYSIFLFNLAIQALPSPIQIGNAGNSLRKRGQFSVQQTANPNYKGVDGMMATCAAYAKYNGTMPQWLVNAMAVRTAATANSTIGTNSTTGGKQSGSVSATPEANDREFLSPINIGGQNLNVDFDSGSSDLWVFSTQQPATESAGHSVFDPAKSTTFQPLQGFTYAIRYGDGSTSQGTVGTDTVEIGGVTVTQQAVELANAVSGSFIQDVANDGLLGLAFSTLNQVQPQPQLTFFDTAIQQGLAQPVFTVDLKKGAPGTYDFGTIDQAKFAGTLESVPINNSSGFWQFSSTGFAVGNQATLTTTNFQAIADTGTTLLLIDPVVVEAYYGQVQGAVLDQQIGGVVFPCDAALPDLVLEMGGGYQSLVKGDLLNLAVVQGNTCFGGMQSNQGIPFAIYGDVWYKSSFVVHDASVPQLQVAPKAGV